LNAKSSSDVTVPGSPIRLSNRCDANSMPSLRRLGIAYSHSRKSPMARKGGQGFADPDYEISVDWLAAREAIHLAQRSHEDDAEPARILIINGSLRSEHTCPGEMSKTWRLVKLAEPAFHEMGLVVDIPAHLGVRQANLSLQILRLDFDGALSLAMQLLS
jgi:hypothetical protein